MRRLSRKPCRCSQPTKLKVIGSVTSRANSALVKPGTTADVYSISAAQQDKSSVFSRRRHAEHRVVGDVVGAGRVRRAEPSRLHRRRPSNQHPRRRLQPDRLRARRDPRQRSFDNYRSKPVSSLGQQELQVYTGATPANAEANGISGYINQVIRTGTAPAYRLLDLGAGAPTFYNKMSFETGGANPSRTFSYYVGTGLYNQNYRSSTSSTPVAVSQQWITPLAPCVTGVNAAGVVTSVASPSLGAVLLRACGPVLRERRRW